MIRAVLCDIGEVLTHSDQSFTISALVWEGVPYGIAKDYFGRADYLELARGRISASQFWLSLMSEYDNKVDSLILARAHKHHIIEGREDVMTLLDKLAARLLFATDTVQPEFDRYRELLGMLDYPVWRSDKAGLLKRDEGGMAEVYEWAHICIHEELSPSEVLFIDDSPVNCQAACAQGMQAVHFQNASDLAVRLAGFGLL